MTEHRIHYLLDERHETIAVDFATWAKQIDDPEKRRVGLTMVETPQGKFEVSTVFLGLDHRFGGNGPPILFETMVFAPDTDTPMRDLYCARYCSWGEALSGHEKTVRKLKDGTLETY